MEKVIKLRNYIPNSGEQQILRSFVGEVSLLAQTERFFLALCNVPFLSLRMEMFKFKLQFTEVIALQQSRVTLLRASHDSVRHSEAFKIVLKYILAFGNYMNGGTKKGQCFGFKLSSLRQVCASKTIDNKSTLLHYLYLEIEKNENDKNAVEFVTEFECLAQGSRLDVSQLSAEIGKIGGTLTKLKKKLDETNSRNDSMKNDLLPQFNAVRTQHSNVSQKCAELSEFLNCKNGIKYEFFKDLYEF